MVLPWKCRSVLPTAWAISWTSREKGSFTYKHTEVVFDILENIPSQFYHEAYENITYKKNLKVCILKFRKRTSIDKHSFELITSLRDE